MNGSNFDYVKDLQILSDVQYQQIRSTRNAQYAGFTGEVIFEYVVPSNRVVRKSEVYLNVRFDCSQGSPATALLRTDGAGANVQGLAEDPAACLFSTARLSIGDEQVSRSNEYPQISAMLKRCYSTVDKQSNKDGCKSPVVPYNKSKVYPMVNQAGTAMAFLDAAGYVRYTVAELTRFNSTDGGTNESLVSALPLSFLNSDLGQSPYIHGGTKIQVSLTVDPQWRTHLVKSTADAVVPTTGTVAAANTIRVDVADIVLYFPTMLVDRVPQNVQIKHFYNENTSSQRPVTTQTFNESFSLPHGTKTILMGFFNPSKGKDAPGLTSFGADAVEKLSSIRLDWGGNSFPTPVYDSLDTNRDWSRAYSDYVRNINQWRHPEATALSYAEWRSSPIFVFVVDTPAGDLSNTAVVALTFSSAPTNSNLMLLALHPKACTVEYDNNSQISSVDVRSFV